MNMAPFIKVQSDAGDERYIRWDHVVQVVDETTRLVVGLSHGYSFQLAGDERKRFLEVLNTISMQRPSGRGSG
jgi:hypothetical protein